VVNISIYQRCRTELERYEAEKSFPEGFIGLNKKILDIQESVRGKLGPTPPVSAHGLENLRSGEPALSGAKVEIPALVFVEAARELAAAFSEVAGQQFPLEKVLALPYFKGDDASGLAEDLSAGRLDLATVAGGSGFNIETVAFFFHSLMVPFFEHQAEAYQLGIANREIRWAKGICPVCGTLPRYGVYYGEKGFRKLYCGLCRTEWPYPRHKCPFCENPERATLRLLKLGKDEAHVAEVCDTCHMYLKATDERVLTRECLPAAEDTVTAAIDLAAAKEGLSRPA